ncbi:hypothetical protein KM043_002824 [Ampulex compressa]|nr:hypothetical protein KM043_002824 [Ampulex compressa]
MELATLQRMRVAATATISLLRSSIFAKACSPRLPSYVTQYTRYADNSPIKDLRRSHLDDPRASARAYRAYARPAVKALSITLEALRDRGLAPRSRLPGVPVRRQPTRGGYRRRSGPREDWGAAWGGEGREEGPYRLASGLSLDTPFSGSPTPGGGPWLPFSPHRDTDKVTHPEKGQSVGCSEGSFGITSARGDVGAVASRIEGTRMLLDDASRNSSIVVVEKLGRRYVFMGQLVSRVAVDRITTEKRERDVAYVD